MLRISQYWVASTNPATPSQARTDASQGVGAARTTKSSGTRPNQTSHHHDGAGKASAGSAPTTNAAARPRNRWRGAMSIRMPLGFADGAEKSGKEQTRTGRIPTKE